ncbi:MAG TPA: DNA translocase FtsK [Dehalococcoidia bacterium]|nr:DNA translocase FtsK [Dehalococcoidia bacterium]
MARTGVRARPGSRSGRSRSGWLAVGRKRQGPSPTSLAVAWATRLETAGLYLAGITLILCVWLAAGRSAGPIDSIVEAFGVLTYVFAALIVAAGVLIWRQDLAMFTRYPRPLLIAIPIFLFVAGILGLFKPDFELGGTSLAEITAGGSFGLFLTDSALGVLLWVASGSAIIIFVWPDETRSAIEGTPGAMATVWSWRIPHRILAGMAMIVDFAFPTKPPPDEAIESAPAWLPEEEEFDEELEPTPLPVSVLRETEPEIPDNRLSQAELPVNWWDPDVTGDEDEPPVVKQASPWKLPPMDLLASAPPTDESARPDNNLRASLIVDTLSSFGVDARVSQFHEGPVVTQFDVEPGWEVKYKTIPERDRDGKPILDKDGKPRVRQEETSRTRVRVNQITTLSNDLALALAAPSLRIEAPVPGRSVVGIEVPNSSASVVTLRSVIETPAFQRLAARTKIALPLGKSVSGEPVVADLAKMPHLLIAGATGSGKSVAINSIIASILMQAEPEDVRFVMIDPKRVELAGFSMIPHLAFSNIVVDVEKVVGTLGAVLHEMEARYKRFASLAVRNIDSYNKHPKVTQRMPYWVVIIDELADLMMAAPFEVERQICRLAQLARATGIHLIVATQRPSVDVITGLIKANFPTRIAFAMTSQVDSRTILDMAGAERLLGRGDMLYMPTDSSKPKRVQGVYLSDQEIDRLVAFWAQQRTKHSTQVYDHLLDAAQAEIEDEEDADPMYDKAKALAEEHSRLSTSMLQRRLRIGYPRAARIMDRLEEEGIVGGGGSRGGSREVLSGDDDDLDDEEPGFRPPVKNPWDD